MKKQCVSDRENEILENIIEILRTKLNPDRIILFGSRAKGKARPASDFDIAVDSEEPSVVVSDDIRQKIDVVSGLYSVDIIYLKNVKPEFRSIVEQTGRLLYG